MEEELEEEEEEELDEKLELVLVGYKEEMGQVAP